MNSFKLAEEAEQAIDWKVIFDSGEMTSRDRKKFDEWLRSSTSNARAWAHLSNSLSHFDVARQLSLPRGRLADQVLGAGISRRTTVLGIFGIMGFGALAVTSERFVPFFDITADHVTMTGEQRTISMADGTDIILGPRTAIDMDDKGSTRSVTLLDGEVMVKSRHNDKTPLVVKNDSMTLTGNGGTFVARKRNKTSVIAAIDTAGLVDCGGFKQVRLGRAQCVVQTGSRFETRPSEIRRETAWVDGLLVIDNHSVEDTVADLRPYFAGVIRVDPAVADLCLTGVFSLSDPVKAVDLIASTLDLKVTHIGRVWISISRNEMPS